MKKVKAVILGIVCLMSNIITLPAQAIAYAIWRLTKQGEKTIEQMNDDAEFVEGALDDLDLIKGKDITLTNEQFYRIVDQIADYQIKRNNRLILGAYSLLHWFAKVTNWDLAIKYDNQIREVFEDLAISALYLSGTRYRVKE